MDISLKKVAIFGLIIALALFAFSTYLSSFDVDSLISDDYRSDCERVGGYIAKGMCANWWNGMSLDSSTCPTFKTNSFQDMCYRYIANGLNDTSLCFFVKDSYQRGLCLADIATVKNDLSICQNVDETYVREMCYTWSAHNMKNYNLCENVKTTDTRDWCYGLFSDDAKPKICARITKQEERDECYYESMVSGAGCKACKTVITKRWRDLCDDVLSRAACSKTITIDECNAKTDNVNKSICYRNVAWTSEDGSICTQITDTYQKDMCFVDVTREINRYRDDNNTALCPSVSNAHRQECYDAAV